MGEMKLKQVIQGDRGSGRSSEYYLA